VAAIEAAAASSNKVTAESMIARARAMMPTVRARAKRAEELRRLPEETHRDFIDAGFYRVVQPARYGGYELDYGTQAELGHEIAQGCASSGWIASITACHAWIAGMFPPEAQEHVWGDDSGTLVASAFQAPQEYRLERAGGGWRASGRWKFSSGVDLCQWAVISTPVPAPEGKGPPERMMALVPLKDATIEDVWFVNGLCGTGSNDIILRDLFIPDAHTLRASDCAGGPTPGSAVNPHHIFRLPLFGVFPYNLVGIGVGAAKGMVDLMIDHLKVRNTATMHLRMAALQSAQLRVARAAGAADGARTILARNLGEMNSRARANLPIEPEHRIRYRRDAGFASLLFLEAVQGMFPLLGGGGLDSSSPTQRQWRDAHAIGQHIACSWDSSGSHYGAAVLGMLPPEQW
jgi:3-hydroxy-9,10-secoandrosta-1,3,5(10)-triene-9,17-dione monooxygenase